MTFIREVMINGSVFKVSQQKPTDPVKVQKLVHCGWANTPDECQALLRDHSDSADYSPVMEIVSKSFEYHH